MKELSYIARVVLMVAIAVSVFLFALGFRYEKISDMAILDTWTREVYIFPSEEIPVIIDGEKAKRGE